MIRIKTYQFGLLFTGITDCISNVKCVKNNIHVIIYSIDMCGFTLIIMFNYYLFNRH